MREEKMEKLVSYTIKTPLGKISIRVEEGLPACITFAGEEAICEAGQSPPPPAVEELIKAMKTYFSGGEVDSSMAEALIAYIDVTPFEEAVFREVAGIPPGKTASYGEVAEMAGHPRAARAVGNVMHSNPFPIIIPCHRVIKSDGSLGGYGGSEHIKAWLLDFEGAKDGR
jgi:methylated-DNA-[protein]-cysteine S-methyltransferase